MRDSVLTNELQIPEVSQFELKKADKYMETNLLVSSEYCLWSDTSVHRTIFNLFSLFICFRL